MIDFAEARMNMVESQVRTNDVTDLAVQDAMRVVERERFCAPGRRHLAYAEAAVEYAPGLYLLEPRSLSKLLQAIYPRPGERALAICAPYAAAVLAHAELKVILHMPDTAAQAAVDGALQGSERVILLPGDPSTVPGGPYDVIVCEGAVTETPEAWKDALAIGGRMAVIERHGPVGKAQLYVRSGDGLISRREMFDATPPYLPGFEPAVEFVF